MQKLVTPTCTQDEHNTYSRLYARVYRYETKFNNTIGIYIYGLGKYS